MRDVVSSSKSTADQALELFVVGSKWAWSSHDNPRNAPHVWFEISGCRWQGGNMPSNRNGYAFELEHVMIEPGDSLPSDFTSRYLTDEWLIKQRQLGRLVPL